MGIVTYAWLEFAEICCCVTVSESVCVVGVLGVVHSV